MDEGEKVEGKKDISKRNRQNVTFWSHFHRKSFCTVPCMSFSERESRRPAMHCNAMLMNATMSFFVVFVFRNCL